MIAARWSVGETQIAAKGYPARPAESVRHASVSRPLGRVQRMESRAVKGSPATAATVRRLKEALPGSPLIGHLRAGRRVVAPLARTSEPNTGAFELIRGDHPRDWQILRLIGRLWSWMSSQ